MSLLQAGVDTTVIALWLGHASVRSTDASPGIGLVDVRTAVEDEDAATPAGQ
jgi:site-specific recombinase XerD